MSFYVSILASQRNGTLCVGMTDDLAKRIWMHREGGASRIHQEVRSEDLGL